jgi:hypothetical protein
LRCSSTCPMRRVRTFSLRPMPEDRQESSR